MTTFSDQLPDHVQQLGFYLGIVLAAIGLIGGVFHWQKARVATKNTPPTPTPQHSRLSKIKKQLRNHILEADHMYDKILTEKAATQSLPEAERRGRLSVFVVPDCLRWHNDVEALIAKELGRSQANEFAFGWKHVEADWPTDLDFLMKFLGVKRSRLRDLANRITKADLE